MDRLIDRSAASEIPFPVYRLKTSERDFYPLSCWSVRPIVDSPARHGRVFARVIFLSASSPSFPLPPPFPSVPAPEAAGIESGLYGISPLPKHLPRRRSNIVRFEAPDRVPRDIISPFASFAIFALPLPAPRMSLSCLNFIPRYIKPSLYTHVFY